MAAVASLLAAASGALAIGSLFVRVDPSVGANLAAGPAGAGTTPLADRSGATPMTAALAAVGRTVAGSGLVRSLFPPDRIRRRLAAAGLDRRWSADQVMGLRVVAATGGLALGLLIGFGVIGGTLAATAGGALPGFLVGRAARRRTVTADRAVPELLDLLAAGSAAGLGAPLALRRAVPIVQGALSHELVACLLAVDHGARWRDELGAVADRLDLPDLRRAVAAIVRTETLGSSLADALRDLAADVRAARRSRAAERARTAPVKMLFPLVFLILPAFLLLTVVPVLLATLRSIG